MGDTVAAEIRLRIAIEMCAIPAMGGVWEHLPLYRRTAPLGALQFRYALGGRRFVVFAAHQDQPRPVDVAQHDLVGKALRCHESEARRIDGNEGSEALVDPESRLVELAGSEQIHHAAPREPDRGDTFLVDKVERAQMLGRLQHVERAAHVIDVPLRLVTVRVDAARALGIDQQHDIAALDHFPRPAPNRQVGKAADDPETAAMRCEHDRRKRPAARRLVQAHGRIGRRQRRRRRRKLQVTRLGRRRAYPRRNGALLRERWPRQRQQKNQQYRARAYNHGPVQPAPNLRASGSANIPSGSAQTSRQKSKGRAQGPAFLTQRIVRLTARSAGGHAPSRRSPRSGTERSRRKR